jgi:hypothetical protein
MAAERMVEVKQRSSVRIRVNQTLGTLAMEQGKLELAEKLLRGSLTGITAAGSSGRSVRGTTTYKLLAQLEMLRGNWPAALDWHGQRAALVKDFVKRFKWKGPVFEISALTREGCEPLIREIYKHIKAQQVAEQTPVEVDPRFAPGPDA